MLKNTRMSRHANIIFDIKRADTLKTFRGYLDNLEIVYCERYGD